MCVSASFTPTQLYIMHTRETSDASTTHLDEHVCACVKHITATDGAGDIDSESEEYKKAAETVERRLDAYLVEVRACRVLLGVNWATDTQVARPRPTHWNPQARHANGTRTHATYLFQFSLPTCLSSSWPPDLPRILEFPANLLTMKFHEFSIASSFEREKFPFNKHLKNGERHGEPTVGQRQQEIVGGCWRQQIGVLGLSTVFDSPWSDGCGAGQSRGGE